MTGKAQTPGFGPPKQIDAGVLNIRYAELEPPRGRPVVLHHGWPYDIHSYADVAPLLASGGYSTIVPRFVTLLLLLTLFTA
jgi:pimeloyl-ACP methyl ester carboxylesterase